VPAPSLTPARDDIQQSKAANPHDAVTPSGRCRGLWRCCWGRTTARTPLLLRHARGGAASSRPGCNVLPRSALLISVQMWASSRCFSAPRGAQTTTGPHISVTWLSVLLGRKMQSVCPSIFLSQRHAVRLFWTRHIPHYKLNSLRQKVSCCARFTHTCCGKAHKMSQITVCLWDTMQSHFPAG